MAELNLTPEQEAEAQRLATISRTDHGNGRGNVGPTVASRRSLRRQAKLGMEPGCHRAKLRLREPGRDGDSDASQRGGKAEGRMVTVGMIYNPQPRQADEDALSKPSDGVRYLAGLTTLDELGLQLRRQVAQVGMDAAEVWIALTDGGNGLEEFIDTNFPRAQKIIDFQHVAGHVGVFAKQFRPGDKGDRWLAAWCHILKHAVGKQLIRVLDRLDRKKMTAEMEEGLDDLLRYLGNQVHRMDYPRYLQRGRQIASGAVESAWKTVINQRLCLGGMRWGEEGSDAVAHLRALYRSDADLWDAFWAMPA